MRKAFYDAVHVNFKRSEVSCALANIGLVSFRDRGQQKRSVEKTPLPMNGSPLCSLIDSTPELSKDWASIACICLVSHGLNTSCAPRVSPRKSSLTYGIVLALLLRYHHASMPLTDRKLCRDPIEDPCGHTAEAVGSRFGAVLAVT